MKLNYKEEREVEEIIKSFGEVEHEQVYKFVEHEMDRLKHNPAEDALANFLNRIYDDREMIGRVRYDCDAQDMAHKFMWDYLTKAEERNLAERIWKEKTAYREVA